MEKNNNEKLESMDTFKKLITALDAKLDSIDSRLKQQQGREGIVKYYRNEDLKRAFGLSSNTIIKYRLTGVLPFTKLGDIFLYEASKIDKILRDNEC